MHAFSLNMGLHHRHLLDSPSDCVKACAEKKPPPSCTPCAPPPPPPPYIYDSPKQHIETKYLIISFSIVAAAFIVLCLYAIYVKFLSPRRNRNRNRSITRTTLSHPQAEQDFLDEEQEQEQEQNGPVVDHHIWYIRTAGLQPAVVAAITVCKYKKDEGLIEGTECSVCLSEFQEEESVRLLPKCNHAFHLPCIDTWLGSHTNCPMCRAPIVTDPARVPSMDPTAFSSSSNFVQEVLENSDEEEEERAVQEVQVCETETETENSASEVVTLQQPRRSVSLDSSSAAKISLALATVVSEESHGNHSKRVVATKGGSSSSSSTSSVKRSRSFNAKHLLSLYGYGRSQRKPNPPLRSF